MGLAIEKGDGQPPPVAFPTKLRTALTPLSNIVGTKFSNDAADVLDSGGGLAASGAGASAGPGAVATSMGRDGLLIASTFNADARSIDFGEDLDCATGLWAKACRALSAAGWDRGRATGAGGRAGGAKRGEAGASADFTVRAASSVGLRSSGTGPAGRIALAFPSGKDRASPAESTVWGGVVRGTDAASVVGVID
jgi:hypothetical protein